MNDDAKPDYTTMSGAEFKRAVGADPEKWAEAFVQRGLRQYRDVDPPIDPGAVASWFRDFGEAAVKDVILQGTQMALDEMRRDPELEENRRRVRVAREHEVARRHGAEPSE